MLGSLLFNIFLADLFFIINDIDIANYADDNPPYIVADNSDDLIKSLEEASFDIFHWFDNDLLESNPDKCYSLISSNKDNINIFGSNEYVTVHVG